MMWIKYAKLQNSSNSDKFLASTGLLASPVSAIEDSLSIFKHNKMLKPKSKSSQWKSFSPICNIVVCQLSCDLQLPFRTSNPHSAWLRLVAQLTQEHTREVTAMYQEVGSLAHLSS